MHDTLLIEKVYQSIAALCAQNGIVKVRALNIEVDMSSHITGDHLLEHLIYRDKRMFDNNTAVTLTQKPFQKLTAVITGIEGDGIE